MEYPDIARINPNQTFNFKCHPEISCFNECCQNLQQVLSPYDILRLKHHLKCDSSTFLDTYTVTYTGPESGLPIIEIKNKSQHDLHCIFVSEKGCLVYPDRPATCRYYPLGRLLSKSRKTGNKNESFILIKEAHCKGHEIAFKQNINQWRKEQALFPFDTYNDLMIHLISAKNISGLKTLSDDQKALIYKCCYDIDAFRQYGLQKKIFKKEPFPHSLEGDIEILHIAINFLVEHVIK